MADTGVKWNENDYVRDKEGKFADKPGSDARPRTGTAGMPYADGDSQDTGSRVWLAAHAHEAVDAMPDRGHATDADQSRLRSIALDADPCDTRLTCEICGKGDKDTIGTAVNNRFMDDATFREHGALVRRDARYLSDAQQIAVDGRIPANPSTRPESDEQLHSMLVQPGAGYRRSALDSNMNGIIRDGRLWDVAASDPEPANRRRLAENCGLPDGHPCRIGAYRGVVGPADTMRRRTPEGLNTYAVASDGNGMHLERRAPGAGEMAFRTPSDDAGWMPVKEEEIAEAYRR